MDRAEGPHAHQVVSDLEHEWILPEPRDLIDRLPGLATDFS